WAGEAVAALNMVMSFRVSDLQMLLGFVGRSKSGLKHELVTRALQLVQFDCSPEVFKKIKELYETRYNKKGSEVAPPSEEFFPEPVGGRGRVGFFSVLSFIRELQPGVKSVQVVLRICYTDTSSPQEDQYPPNIAVKVNHSYCSVPGYYPSNKPGVEPKRPCRPINLTHLMYLSAATNRITVTWGNYGKSYSVGLYLVRQMTSAELLQRLKTIGIKHPELCKALVKEKLRLDPDSEIATTGVRVSLICPLVKMRLSVPCRAETCAHLQCFDAVFYLQMNEKKPTWMCPVCDKPAPYDQLIIDGLLSKILTECEDADEIEYLVDGSWCPIRAEKERSCSPQCPILVLGEQGCKPWGKSHNSSMAGVGGDLQDHPVPSLPWQGHLPWS
uniref:RING-type E3 ubiquitin transferase n=1 Tax=Zonotrichia albicollis TaxID=44394 RepID=A0A8D2MFI9_ZONAL